MPGILPMKVIKIGSAAQARIAQACDRCRSKKIRCDGVRPSCTQCISVGFECKTSDKLSRRAFPRGYTESLEERVRALEAEVRELKDLLDEKDEKIDMLSRIRSHSTMSSASHKSGSKAAAPMTVVESKEGSPADCDEVFKIVQPPTSDDSQSGSPIFSGTSSSRFLIDAFRRNVQDGGKVKASLDTDAFFHSEAKHTSTLTTTEVYWTAPARLLSDQLVNVFFQEITPLFPILHRPTFLSLYGDYGDCPEAMQDKASLAQLNLVFGIAALSTKGAKPDEIKSFETQWHAALDSVIMDDSLVTLQCLVLAQLYCLLSADYSRLLKYKGIAVGLSQRLGLHQTQKRFGLSALTSETRKKVFWTLYTLDSFSAAHLGLPTLLANIDVHCEYPADADDEFVTEEGFLPSSPGESTKLSSALALFRLARVLSTIIQEVYSGTASYVVSCRKIESLQDDLDQWTEHLAPHLSLRFEMDKPSTGVISSRSPLISLAFHYTQTLISRAAVLASPSPNSRLNSSVLSLASSSKCIIQVLELLEERNLAFAFCINKDEILLQSACCLLFQSFDLGLKSAVSRDNAKLIGIVAEMLNKDPAAGYEGFRKAANALTKGRERKASPRSSSNEKTTPPVEDSSKRQKNPLKMLASRLTGSINRSTPNLSTAHSRRATLPHVNTVPDITQQSPFSRSEIALSPPPPEAHRHSMGAPRTLRRQTKGLPNLDYLPFGVAQTDQRATSMLLPNNKEASNPADWERLLSSLDNGQTTIWDGIYGGPGCGQPPSLADLSSLASASPDATVSCDRVEVNQDGFVTSAEWSPANVWAAAPDSSGLQQVHVPQSVLSFESDEGDDWGDLCLSNMSSLDNGYGSSSISIPHVDEGMIMGPAPDGGIMGEMGFGFNI